jgi:hypothetical protein
MSPSAYDPLTPARRPGDKPDRAPKYRVLVHRRFKGHWEQLVERVGLESAKQFWDHVAHQPGVPPLTDSSVILRGKAGRPKWPGFSKTRHYEVSSMARIDYQYCDEYSTQPGGDLHKIVAILTINFSSH